MGTTIAAVLFDLDGTLFDTAPDFAAVVNRMRQEEALEPLPEEQVRSSVSYGSRGLVELSWGINKGEPGHEERCQRLLSDYANHLSVHTQPFPGINDLLSAIEQQGLNWGIVTNKPELYAIPLIQAQGFAKRCKTLICPDHVTYSKPSPEALLLACRELGVTPEHCVYVGDHLRDIEAGKAAGMVTIAAAYGYIASEREPSTWEADYVAYSAIDVLNWLADQNWCLTQQRA